MHLVFSPLHQEDENINDSILDHRSYFQCTSIDDEGDIDVSLVLSSSQDYYLSRHVLGRQHHGETTMNHDDRH